MKRLARCWLGLCLAVSFDASAQASPEAIIPMEFIGSGEGYTVNAAVEAAVSSAELKARQAGYGSCQLTHYSYWPETIGIGFNASAAMTCYKDTTPPPPPPPPPPGTPPTIYPIAREADGTTHVVSWKSNIGCDRFALHRRVNGGGWKEIYKGGSLSWRSAGIAPSVYDYRVQDLCSSSGALYSEIATIIISTAPPQPEAPISSAVVGPNHTISWQPSSGAQDYRLERESGDGWASVYLGPDTRWTASDMPPGVYRYRVVACTNGACSAPSGITELRVVADMTPIVTYLLGD